MIGLVIVVVTAEDGTDGTIIMIIIIAVTTTIVTTTTGMVVAAEEEEAVVITTRIEAVVTTKMIIMEDMAAVGVMVGVIMGTITRVAEATTTTEAVDIEITDTKTEGMIIETIILTGGTKFIAPCVRIFCFLVISVIF